MVSCCWSVKGGVGTTVVAAGMALAAPAGRSVLLVDLAGDLPAVLGLAEPLGPGVAEWSVLGRAAPPDALARLEVPVRPGLSLLPAGRGPAEPCGDLLAALLAADPRRVVVDGGRIDPPRLHGLAGRVAAASAASLLVTRACAVALRRGAATAVRPTGVVVVRDPGRAFTTADIEAALGARVVVEVAVDPAVARAVDAGLAPGRLPRSFARALAARW